MKLVINSHVNYKYPLKIFLNSLLDSGFTNLKDIILVISGAPTQIAPRIINAKQLCDSFPDIELCIIEMQINNFDYTGYHALHLYKDDPMILDTSYLYVLDTCTFDLDFGEKYKTFKIKHRGVATCAAPHSNICMFDRQVIFNYGDNFFTPITKQEAIDLEFGRSLTKNGREIKSITSFGKFINIGNRVHFGEKDIYNTLHPRQGFNYPYFGINKWIFWGRNGDIYGKIN